MISAVKQSNCVIPPVTNKPGGRYSPVNFTASPAQNEQDSKTKERKTALITGVVLGIVGAAALFIYKRGKYNKDFTKIFDKTWENVSKDFNKEGMKIKKPFLGFFSSKKADEWAAYMPGGNDIIINLHKFNNYEYFVYKSGNGRTRFQSMGGIPLFNTEGIEKLKKDKIIDDSWIIEKANHAEKMFCWNYLIAHEQRHCAQFHVMLNDSKVGPEGLLKDVADKLRKSKSGLSEEEAMKIAKRRYPYWTNFKTNGKFENVYLTMHNVTQDGKHILLGSKHLARNAAEYTFEDLEKYKLNSLEMDANTFAENYVRSNKEIQQGCRENILNIIMGAQKLSNSKNIDKFVDMNRKYAA